MFLFVCNSSEWTCLFPGVAALPGLLALCVYGADFCSCYLVQNVQIICLSLIVLLPPHGADTV